MVPLGFDLVCSGMVLSVLREREVELDAIDSAVERLSQGRSGLLVFEGPAGIGKTELLVELRARAMAAGVRALWARGSELEQNFSFGVVGQLFEPVVFSGAEDRDRLFSGAAALSRPLFEAVDPTEGEVEEELQFRRRHGLFWLAANLASDGPVAIVIDDAQWADEPSVGFVRHLVTRLEAFPVLVAVATRPAETGLSGLMVERAARVLRPRSLSAGAVRDWIGEALAEDADEAFAEAVRNATDGNPFMVVELLREVGHERLAPRAAAVDRLRDLSPRGVRTSTLLRLAGLAAPAGALARALSVLGETKLGFVAELAGLEPEEATLGASELAAADVLRSVEPPAFVHPLVRTVLYSDISAVQRPGIHARAARLLHAAGARSEEVAAQLLLTSPIGESWAAESLISAAREAAARGAPEVAVRFLERALPEVSEDGRFELLLALGRLGVLAGRSDAVESLRTAARAADDAQQRVKAAVSLGRVLRYAAAGAEAVALLQQADTQAEGDDAHRLIEQELLATSTVSYGARRVMTSQMRQWQQTRLTDPQTTFERLLIASQGVEGICQGDTVAQVVEHAQAALAGPLPAGHLGRHVRLLAAYVFLLADQFERVHPLLDQLAEIAIARGGGEMLATIAAQRALTAWRMGDLRRTQTDAEEALRDYPDPADRPSFLLTASAALIYVAVARGEAVDDLAARTNDDGDSLFARHLGYATALLAIAEGRVEQGVDALMDLGERELAIGWEGPAQFSWRSDAALALETLGRGGQARELADEELHLARRCGAPRALGVALRARALLADGEERLDGLQEAVAVLQTSGARLEHARALADLGSALRLSRRPARARGPLARATELADACGAERLARHAYAELLATGARPRRTALSGLASLTPSEMRVAELASGALRNRDIARRLFVTEKTVEAHLGHTYAKLGIRSRRELAQALADAGPDSAQ